MSLAEAKEQMMALRVQAEGLKIAMLQARIAQDALAASSKLQASQAAAQIDGMAAMSKMLSEKRLADAKAQAVSEKGLRAQDQVQAAQTKAAAATDKATASQTKATGVTDKAAQASAKAGADVNRLGDAMMGAAQSSTSAGGAIGVVQGILAKLGPQGQAAAVLLGAYAIAIGAVVGALRTLGETAVEVISRQAGLSAVFGALARGAAGGSAVLASVDALRAAIPAMAGEIEEWGKSLVNAGLYGVRLENALKAVAAANAMLGSSGASAAQGMIQELQRGGIHAARLIQELKGPEGDQKLRAMGLSVKELAASLGMSEAQFKRARLSADQMQQAIERALIAKGKGPLEAMALTWPSILAGAKQGILSLFSGLGPQVKIFMTAVKGLFSEFSKGGSAIRYLKPIVTAVMSAVFQWATKGVQAVRELVKSFTQGGKGAGVLGSAATVLKSAWSVVKTVFTAVVGIMRPMVAVIRQIFGNAMAMQGLRAIFTVIATVVKAAFVALVVLLGAMATAAGAAAALGAAVVGVLGGALAQVSTWVEQAIAALSGLTGGASSAAAGFVQGLVSGIAAGAGAIVAAVKGLASGAVGAFKGALGIASPSKVMSEMGGHTAAGFEQGVDAGAGDAQKAMSRLAAPPKAASGKGGAGGADRSITFNSCTFGTGLDESTLRGWLVRILEDLDAEGPVGATP